QTKWQWRSTGPIHRDGRQIELRLCLGVILCTECGRPYRPKTDAGARKLQLRETCTGPKDSGNSRPASGNGSRKGKGTLCGKPLYHVECSSARTHHYKLKRNNRWFYVWEHFGVHEHAKPPKGRLTAEEDAAVDAQVAIRPNASVHEYRTGDTVQGSIPIGRIAPSLADPRIARYQVEKSRNRLGLEGPRAGKGLVGLLGSVSDLNERFPTPFMIDSAFHGPTYIVFRTPFMLRMLQECVNSWGDTTEVARHGMVTDGDHTFFKDGVLNVTCVFSNVLSAWTPVLYTWILGLDTEHHRPHFHHISREIAKHAVGKGIKLEPKLFLHVTDFSAAQRAAHAEEYADAIISTKPDFQSLTSQSQEIERKAYLQQAQEAESGCDFHFWQSVERLISNGNLVRASDAPDFNHQLRIMTSRSTSRERFDTAVKKIRDSYSQVDSWLSWWLRPAFASMIFPACSSVDPVVANEIPSTSNAAEHSHGLLHHASGKDHDLVPGIEKLYLHVEELERQYDAVKASHFDPPEPRVYKPAAQKTYDVNDGRPPDTQRDLLPDGIRNTSTQNKHFLQSYQWDPPNSCFFDNGMELLFRSFVLLPRKTRLDLMQAVPVDNYLSSLLYNFNLRLDALYSAPDARRFRDITELMQLVTRNRIFDIWNLYDDPATYGNCKQWIIHTVLEGNMPREVKGHFGIYHMLVRLCSNDHKHEEYASDNPQIFSSLLSRDINMVNNFIPTAPTTSITLGNYFSHAIPRASLYKSGKHGQLLHTLEHTRCNSCKSSAPLVEITTIWPHTLHIEYIGSRDLPRTREPPMVSYPHNFVIEDESESQVSYELVGRVLHDSNHFTSEIRIAGTAYTYNDMKAGGKLVQHKDNKLLESPNSHAVYYVYHRTSTHDKVSFCILSEYVLLYLLWRLDNEIGSEYSGRL
ncbi:hypothetical protein CPC08DRAFT_648784, partial [Agrocybe pediades]